MVRKKDEPQPELPKLRQAPATSAEQRETQLISAAVDLAEKQIREGTATAQIVVHYLKLGSSREKLEQEKIRNENSLLATKKELMESEMRTEALISEALKAMRSYTGSTDSEEEPFQDEDGY